MDMVSIYVLPTEEGKPCRALLFDGDKFDLETDTEIEGSIAQWSSDMGVWTVDGSILPTPLSDAITGHAKSLGVEW